MSKENTPIIILKSTVYLHWCSSKTLDLYLGGTHFEFSPGCADYPD
jgi:hypothetical protein